MMRVRFARESDREGLLALFDAVILDTMKLEGLVGDDLDEAVRDETSYKRHILEEAFRGEDSVREYIIATIDDRIVGSICYGPCSDIIKDHGGRDTEINEIGSAYVLPEYQSKGIITILFNHMVMHLRTRDVKELCFDSGYAIAKKIWTRKFGQPNIILKDFWGETADHYIWYRDPNEMPVEYAIGV